MTWRVCIALIAALVWAAPFATAQSGVTLAVALEAQFRAALIRERRLADDRELQLIAEAEARMRGARADYARAQSDRAAAQSALETARADYVRVVNAVPLRQAASRIEVEAFRAEVEGRLPEATPELIAAYQAFADGDRANAWTTLETLLTARAEARRRAARSIAAAEIRQLAALRDIMRANGEATVADVLRLWDQAASLDPSDANTHLERSSLAQAAGDLPRALRAAEQALETARDPRMQFLAREQRAVVLRNQGRLQQAYEAFRETLASRRALTASQPNDVYLQSDLAVGLTDLAEAQAAIGDRVGALASYEEALTILRRLPPERYQPFVVQGSIGATLNFIARMRMETGNATGAAAAIDESVAISRDIVRQQPGSKPIRNDLANAVGTLGAVRQRQGRMLDAQNAYVEQGEIFRALARADETDIEAQRALANALVDLGQVRTRLGNYPGALSVLEEAAGIFRRAAAADTTDLRARRSISLVLDRIGNNYEDQEDWPHVESVYRELLANARALAVLTPESATLQADISTALLKIGTALTRQGHPQAAIPLHRESVEIDRRLVARDPSASALRSLALSIEYLGTAYLRAEDLDTALAAYEERRSIINELAVADPTNMALQRDLELSFILLGRARLVRNEPDAARDAFRRGWQILIRAIQAGARDPDMTHDALEFLTSLASFSPPDISWDFVDSFLTAIEHEGLSRPGDRDFVRHAREVNENWNRTHPSGH